MDTGEAEVQELLDVARRKGPAADKAFGVLARRYDIWLVHYLTQLLRRQSDAEDVAQEVLTRAFVALASFRGTVAGSFKAWLRIIATRMAFNLVRARSARTRLEAQALAPSPSARHDQRLEARDVVLLVLDRLAYPYREIIVLRHIEELSLEDIAVHLDIGLSAAKMRLKRARDEFRDIYDEVTR